MRFSTAWAKTAAQNVTLKVATVTLSAVAVTQLFLIGQLALRDLPVIERSCFSKVMSAKSTSPNNAEISAFLSEALGMRFDSNTYFREGFLSLEENLARDNEQAALKQRQMSQKINITDVKVESDLILVSADRIVGIGKVKSVLSLNLKVSMQQVNRTEANPYGLILTSVNQIDDKENK